MATSGNAAAQTHCGFGKPATPEEIAGWDIDARPDGSGLPQGSGSVEQGKALYALLLNANKIVPDDAVMSADTLPKVRMPNQRGFKSVRKNENLVQGVRCLKDCR